MAGQYLDIIYDVHNILCKLELEMVPMRSHFHFSCFGKIQEILFKQILFQNEFKQM